MPALAVAGPGLATSHVSFIRLIAKISGFFDGYFVLRDFDSKKDGTVRAQKAKSLIVECLKPFREIKRTAAPRLDFWR